MNIQYNNPGCFEVCLNGIRYDCCVNLPNCLKDTLHFICKHLWIFVFIISMCSVLIGFILTGIASKHTDRNIGIVFLTTGSTAITIITVVCVVTTCYERYKQLHQHQDYDEL